MKKRLLCHSQEKFEMIKKFVWYIIKMVMHLTQLL